MENVRKVTKPQRVAKPYEDWVERVAENIRDTVRESWEALGEIAKQPLGRSRTLAMELVPNLTFLLGSWPGSSKKGIKMKAEQTVGCQDSQSIQLPSRSWHEACSPTHWNECCCVAA